MTDLKFKIYFPPTGKLDGLIRERERVQGCADRDARHYASILKNIDDEIAALKQAQEVEHAQT